MRQRRVAAARVVVAAALGVAAGAVVLVPFVELLGQSANASRGGIALPPASVLSLFLPELWGRPDWAFEGAGPACYLERTFYVGVAPLTLAVIAVMRRGHRDTVFFALACLVAVAVAIDTPLHAVAAPVRRRGSSHTRRAPSDCSTPWALGCS